MEEIKIYRTDWRSIFAGIVCLVFAIMGGVLIYQGKDSGKVLPMFLFFGLGGLFLLFQTVKKRKGPYLTITDKCIIVSMSNFLMDNRTYEVNFAEVDHFELESFNLLRPFSRDLCVYYKKDKNQQLQFKPNLLWRIANKLSSGIDDYISVSGIDMKPQELLGLLNQRLHNK